MQVLYFSYILKQITNVCFIRHVITDYVVDVKYPNSIGYLAPYKGTNIRYHIPDFQCRQIVVIRTPNCYMYSQETETNIKLLAFCH